MKSFQEERVKTKKDKAAMSQSKGNVRSIVPASEDGVVIQVSLDKRSQLHASKPLTHTRAYISCFVQFTCIGNFFLWHPTPFLDKAFLHLEGLGLSFLFQTKPAASTWKSERINIIVFSYRMTYVTFSKGDRKKKENFNLKTYQAFLFLFVF